MHQHDLFTGHARGGIERQGDAWSHGNGSRHQLRARSRKRDEHARGEHPREEESCRERPYVQRDAVIAAHERVRHRTSSGDVRP
jgi:hypothetical protein